MKIKKVPMRMCIVTKERMEKKNLLRIVKTENGIIVDETGKVNGHGYYLQKKKEVIEKAQKTGILDKLFEQKVNEEIFIKAKECCTDE